MNEEIKTKVGYVTPLKRICMTIGELPSSYIESMTYYEMLVWFTNYIQKTLIPTINNNAEAVTELQNLFNELQSYVDNYFDNLDVQEEINNKLDDMIENNQMLEILSPYLYNYINVKSVGAKGDGVTDDTEAIQSAIAMNKPLYFPEGTYILSETITLSNDVNWLGQGNKTIINSRPISDLYPNYVTPVVDFSGCDNINLKGFCSTNSTFKVYPTPTENQTIKQLMQNKTVFIENVTNDIENNSMSGKTNWQGLFINTPRPDNYTRDFHNGKYPRYALDISNNSGYNAINIDNVILKEDGTPEIIPDNSAIGIVDGVLSSAPTIFLDMRAQRNAISIKNRAGGNFPSSTSNPETVFQVGHQGHLSIGCSVYNEDGAQGTGTIKLKDINPSIRFYETEDTSLGLIRQRNGKLEFLANGLTSLAINKNHQLETDYGFSGKIKSNTANVGGALVLKAGNNLNYHLFMNDNGLVTIQGYNDTQTPSDNVGYKLLTNRNGTTGQRPTTLLTNSWQDIGFYYFDTSLNKPIFWNGTGWVDSNGSSV